MEYAPFESKGGSYDVYYTDAGERIVVLEGLDANDRIEQSPMQEYIRAHIDRIELFYWLLLVGVVCLLLLSQIIIPLYKKIRTR